MNIKRNAGLVIMIITAIELCFFICGASMWLDSLSYGTSKSTEQVQGRSFNISTKKEIPTIEGVDPDEIFNNTYYNALNVLSEGIAYGTTWVKLCPNVQIDINGETYVEVCDTKYKSVSSIKAPLKNIVTDKFVNFLMDNNFVEKDGKLYAKPILVSKNAMYSKLINYEVTDISKTNISYKVRSEYSDLNCGGDCDYIYKTHVFELVKEGNNWLVSNMEMPY